MNETIQKFGYPATRLREWAHWIMLVRPSQPTIGSLVLAAKSDATNFAALPAAAFAELAEVIAATEAMLQAAIAPDKINYLMLMMVDPHVHFHVLPRYPGERSLAGLTIEDRGWPGQAVLADARVLQPAEIGLLVAELGRAIDP